MAEYIEREALRSKAVYMHGFGKNKYVPLRAIEEAPAANVAPVVHGRWIDRGWEKGFECSNCHSFALLNYESEYHKSDCCPHCGARMDGTDDV